SRWKGTGVALAWPNPAPTSGIVGSARSGSPAPAAATAPGAAPAPARTRPRRRGPPPPCSPCSSLSVHPSWLDPAKRFIMFQSPVTSGQSPPASDMARRTRRAHSRNGLIQGWRWIMADRKLLGLSATLVLLGGVLLSVLTRFVHPGGGPTEEALAF